ncbi:hypothetical protein FRC04_001876 [Tulasnella sp. 424]|nr:hypothetical protein FRC04_001876 [Tulasnella sp. 424]KAG8977657.1 hypothetical protein FRC05_000913 [Tulasnella sp. 425]
MSQTPKPEHEVILVESSDKELTQQCIDVRIRVFTDEQGFPLETEIDEYDKGDASVHFLLRLLPSLEPIGCIRLVKAKGKIGRLCVLKEYRKYGFGRDLMNKCHELAATKLGTREFQLHSQIPVIPFYAKLGYVPVGDQFDEEGAPHQKMVLTLPST